AARQILVDAIRAVHRPRRAGPAQQEESRGVIELRVDEHDRRYTRVARPADRMGRRMGLALRAKIGRRVHEHERRRIPARDRDGRLRAGTRAQSARTETGAVTAVAIPLREAPARRGAEY